MASALAFGVMGILIEMPNTNAHASDKDNSVSSVAQDTQNLVVSASAAPQKLERDSYTAISAAEVNRLASLGTPASLGSYLQATETSFTIHDKNDGTVIYPLTAWNFHYEDNGYHTTLRPEHNGTDMPIGEGTDIYSVADGVVVEVGFGAEGYGNFAIIRHSIGGYTVETLYGHMVTPPNVVKDQTVKRGDVIGHVGSTGKSTGNHLHFEVTVNGARQDPASWLELNAIR